MPPAFRTPAAPATAETEVRRSRFLARLEPAETEADARAVIQAMRAAHPGPGTAARRSSWARRR